MQLPLNTDRATLFFDAAASRAVLVSSQRGRPQKQDHKFRSPITALRWCITERVHFVLFWPTAASRN
ncbi:MAG TPA: hypothetical protein VGF13_16235 [Verrucomicrobiae bacterium]